MLPKSSHLGLLVAIAAAFVTAGACAEDDDDGGSPEMAGEACVVADECYDSIDPTDLSGPITCLDRVENGYCTHDCQADTDCCAVPGECATPFPQVCSPFESTGQMMCFLSCEKDDIEDYDADDFCRRFAHADFSCRSSGGGSANRKVCVPNG